MCLFWHLDRYYALDEFNYFAEYTNQYIPKINISRIIIWRRPPIFIFTESKKEWNYCQQNIVSHVINTTAIGLIQIVLIIQGTWFSIPFFFYWYGKCFAQRYQARPQMMDRDISKLISSIFVLGLISV